MWQSYCAYPLQDYPVPYRDFEVIATCLFYCCLSEHAAEESRAWMLPTEIVQQLQAQDSTHEKEDRPYH